MGRILKIKEWIFNIKVKNKLAEYFEVADKISFRRKKVIEDTYQRLLERGKFDGKMEETLKTLDYSIHILKSKKDRGEY